MKQKEYQQDLFRREPGLKSLVRSLFNETIAVVKNSARKYAVARLKKGLKDKYGSVEFSIDEIRRGVATRMVTEKMNGLAYKVEKQVEVKRPRSMKMVGRYMANAERLLQSAISRGDIDMAMDGTDIYSWLGQGNRQSVKNKVAKTYAVAKKLSQETGIPLYDKKYDGRGGAIIQRDLANRVHEYLPSTVGVTK